MENKKTLIVGATTNPDRYAHMAAVKLLNYGHTIDLLGIKKGEIQGHAIKRIEDDFTHIHTVTMYVGPQNQHHYEDFILALNPQRVVFNPGTWNEGFIEKLNLQGIEVVDACTLVMLSAGTY